MTKWIPHGARLGVVLVVVVVSVVVLVVVMVVVLALVDVEVAAVFVVADEVKDTSMKG